jgi:DNA-damage-inducible protein J
MSKTETIRARIDPELKQQAEQVLADLGLTPTIAITMLYKQLVHQSALPFEVALPNAATRDAMREAQEGRNLIRANDVDGLLTALDRDD